MASSLDVLLYKTYFAAQNFCELQFYFYFVEIVLQMCTVQYSMPAGCIHVVPALISHIHCEKVKSNAYIQSFYPPLRSTDIEPSFTSPTWLNFKV